MENIVNKEVALNALECFLNDVGPYINGLDSEEIAEIYNKAVKKINMGSKCTNANYMD